MLNMKARIFKYCDMSRQALTELKKWMQRGVDVNIFNNNPTLRIASATNSVGDAVCYCTVESAFVLGSLVHHPKATTPEMFSAANLIEDAITTEAAQTGAHKLLIFVPENWPPVQGERFVRVVQRQIASAVATHTIDHSASHATALVN